MTYIRRFLLCGLVSLAFVGIDKSDNTLNLNDDKTFDDFSSDIKKSNIENNAGEYIGYGYNVTKGKSISEPDALYLTNPILDLTNETLTSNIKVFNSSLTTYESNSAKSAKEVAEDYGNLLSGGIGGKIACVSLDVDAKFNTNTSFSQVQKEEYSYFSIYVKNNTVILQLNEDAIKGLLSASFKKDLYGVNSIDSAKKLFDKYGTHLLTGYIEGGILEMTNYFASDEYNYVKENNLSFDAQVSAGLSTTSAGLDFSFNQTYASKDNNSHAVNQYKCTTYGGKTFPGLTIDQAFDKYETAFEAGYFYQIWTNSINNDENLVIVDVPQSSPMMPLWDLLPSDYEYNQTRSYLLQAYTQLCDSAYSSFVNGYPDIYPTDLNDDLGDVASGIPTLDSIGFNYSMPLDDGSSLNSYVNCELNNSTPYSVENGAEINLNLSGADLVGRQITFETNQKSLLVDFDENTGSFKVSPEASANNFFKISIYSDGILIGDLNFAIQDGFSGGDGSENNPYLISNKDDFIKFCTNDTYWQKGLYFKLVNDIDLNGTTINMIGNENKNFSAYFDGNFCTIKNYKIDANNTTGDSIGLFGVNSGTIVNLNVSNDKAKYDSDFRNFVIENSSNLSYYFKNAGGIVGYNTSTGVIKNVSAQNLNIKLEFNAFYNDVENKNLVLNFGGIVGKNEGLVKRCVISSSNLMARGDYFNYVNCGGIVGEQNSKDTLSECMVDNCSIYARCGIQTSNYVHYAFAGGIVALLKQGVVKDCLVRNINGVESSEKSSRLISLSRGTKKNINLSSCCGGIVAYLETNTRIENSVAHDVVTIKSNYAIEGGSAPASGVKERCGILVGYFYMNDTPSVLGNYLSNVIVEKQGNTPILQSYTEDVFGSIQGLTIVSDLSYSNLTAVFDKNIWSNVNGLPEILNLTPSTDESQYSFNFANVKTEFYIGDPFMVGNLEIQMYSTEGEIVDVTNYRVDSSNFRSDVAGQYTIYIYVYNIVKEYTVTVKAASNLELYLVNDPDDTDYYAGEYFDPTGIELKLVKENGDTILLSEDDLIIPQTKLNDGVNTIKISYQDVSINYEVVAKERNVKSIEIVKEPTKINYNIGEKNIETDGLEVKVYYEDGGTEVIDGSQVDLMYSPIAYGENTVVVTYGGYKSDTFIVYGVSSDLDNILSFVNIVDSISKQQDLKEKFNLINKALTLKEEIVDVNDEKFIDANEKLTEEIDKYNAIINDLNSQFSGTFNLF